jgi:hypothetical protein
MRDNRQLSLMFKSEVGKIKENRRNLNNVEVQNLCLQQMSLIFYIEKLQNAGRVA